jgi:hypothetical protein
MFHHLSDGASGEFVAQIGQCNLDAPIATALVLIGHANHQNLDLSQRARSSGSAFVAAIIFLGNELSMPG